MICFASRAPLNNSRQSRVNVAVRAHDVRFGPNRRLKAMPLGPEKERGTRTSVIAHRSQDGKDPEPCNNH